MRLRYIYTYTHCINHVPPAMCRHGSLHCILFQNILVPLSFCINFFLFYIFFLHSFPSPLLFPFFPSPSSSVPSPFFPFPPVSHSQAPLELEDVLLQLLGSQDCSYKLQYLSYFILFCFILL